MRHSAGELESIRAILHAANFAAEKHASQRRKGAAAEPYINHLLEVANLVSSTLTEPDTDLIVAALLHDVIEDCVVSKEQVEAEFGRDVADLVMEVTDDKTLPKAERKRLQVVNAPKKSGRAQTIQVSVKISNLRAIPSPPPTNWSLERKRVYFVWAKQVIDGLTAPDPALKGEFDRLYDQANALS
jgi:GTP diphosphokinase / guanosine-3',5'-bis(diphosphate) 3'-diphosphatase